MQCSTQAMQLQLWPVCVYITPTSATSYMMIDCHFVPVRPTGTLLQRLYSSSTLLSSLLLVSPTSVSITLTTLFCSFYVCLGTFSSVICNRYCMVGYAVGVAGFIIHNARAYHATSDIYPPPPPPYPDWSVAKETRNVNKTVHDSFNCDNDKEYKIMLNSLTSTMEVQVVDCE